MTKIENSSIIEIKNTKGITMQYEAASIVSLAIIVAIGIIIIKGVVIVPQTHAYVIERLGKYKRTIEGGFHIFISSYFFQGRSAN